jgi:hypothetical protein
LTEPFVRQGLDTFNPQTLGVEALAACVTKNQLPALIANLTHPPRLFPPTRQPLLTIPPSLLLLLLLLLQVAVVIINKILLPVPLQRVLVAIRALTSLLPLLLMPPSRSQPARLLQLPVTTLADSLEHPALPTLYNLAVTFFPSCRVCRVNNGNPTMLETRTRPITLRERGT